MTNALSSALNLVTLVLAYSLCFAIPVFTLLILMYLYKKYKKWESKEVKEAEKIIVKMNEKIVYQGNAVNALDKTKETLSKEITELEEKKKTLTKEVIELDPLHTEASASETTTAVPVEIKELTIKELQDIARHRKIKGFSRMSKTKLLEVLSV